MSTNIIRLHRVLRATPERIYRAFLDADAMAKWLPPNRIDRQGPPLGCQGRRNPQDVVHECHHLTGELQVTVTLKNVSVGTELNIVQEGVPDVIPPEACYLGWQESLTLLAKLVEAEIPD
jgi:uncharacterized protein YndB with AHSA1/START domain